jgi:hypothetical protein
VFRHNFAIDTSLRLSIRCGSATCLARRLRFPSHLGHPTKYFTTMHPDFVFPFYSFLIPHSTCTHAIPILLLSDSFSSYLTTISRILLSNQRTANARFEPSPRAPRITPGINSKWIGHPHSVLSRAALISLYVFVYLPDDSLGEGLILAAVSSTIDSFTYGDCLFVWTLLTLHYLFPLSLTATSIDIFHSDSSCLTPEIYPISS